MNSLDWGICALYFLVLIAITWFKKSKDTSDESYLLAGRKLSLPAFVATLVSTWYGGILGVGEFGFQHGVSQWVVFGLPYYLFALIFAFVLVPKIRKYPFVSLPEAISQTYGATSGKIASGLIFLLTNPAPYVVMLALLFRYLFQDDSSYILYAIGVTLFSLMYVWFGGFSAVVRTDMLQFVLMFVGFILLVYFGIEKVGGMQNVWSHLPESHTNPTGGNSIAFVLVWFFIALWTFVDPGFHQRVTASKSESTAKWGIVISVGCWMVFDLLTLTSSIIGFHLLKDIQNPVLIYPELGSLILPNGIKGLFFLGLLATIMSTMDSFLFLSGQTLGRDGFFPKLKAVHSTRIGMVISAIVAIVLSVLFPSVIHLWYGLGTALIPGLLLSVLGVYIPFFAIPKRFNVWMMSFGTTSSLTWMYLGFQNGPLLGIEPFYVGLICAGMVFLSGKRANSELTLS